MGDISFQNNAPDALLSGKELPVFKFELARTFSSHQMNSLPERRIV